MRHVSGVGALLVEAVVSDGEIRVTDPAYKTRRHKWAKRIGEGVILTIRVEPKEDAIAYGQMKHYYGHLITPVSDYTGETKHEVHVRMKALFLPDGKTSITELNHQEMKDYTEAVEQHMREECPEAWERSVEKTSLYH